MIDSTATILIIDDEIHNRKLLEMLLRHKGYVTLSAAGGEQAQEVMTQCVPDLILLDIMMPGMDGYQLARILKSNPATSSIPIIMVTAQIDRSTRLAGLNAGVEEFLTKPVDQAELWLRVRNLLRLKKALQQSKERLQQLLVHQDKTKEEERKRIAREIHDDLGQNLLALRIDISRLHARTGHHHRLLHQGVSVALNNIDTTIKSVRSIINDLRPFELELGLQAAVTWQLKKFARVSGIACEFDIDAPPGSNMQLGDLQTLTIFRILQESLSNIARHSCATRVDVNLTWSKNGLAMRVRDDGIGMQADAAPKTTSFGIVGIKERISSLGGEFAIDGSSGQGTLLSVFIPIDNSVPS